jgi:hypothetical protein
LQLAGFYTQAFESPNGLNNMIQTWVPEGNKASIKTIFLSLGLGQAIDVFFLYLVSNLGFYIQSISWSISTQVQASVTTQTCNS